MISRVAWIGLVLMGLGFTHTQAAQTPASKPPAAPIFSCASQAVLEALVALIIKSNGLDPTLNFRVSQAQPDSSRGVKKEAQEQAVSCTVHLQIMRSNSEELVDELDIAYRMINQKEGALGLEFVPVRKVLK